MIFFKDLTGQKFGRLTVISLSEKIQRFRKNKPDGHFYKWLCQCECGQMVVVDQVHLKSGHTQSCGCFHKEKIRKTKGLSKTKLFVTWKNILSRCYNKNNKEYKNYGGRGIFICDEWKENFLNFYDWAILNGYNENINGLECSIDRIDNNKGYSPDNCRWVNQKIQSRNKRTTNKITIGLRTQCLTDWCREFDIHPQRVYSYHKNHNVPYNEAINIILNKKWDNSKKEWIKK